MVEALYERLSRAVMLESDDAAIRIRARYAPQLGRSAKVFPPTYLRADGTRYVFEQRWIDDEPVEVVVLDAVQSQAGRAEAALDRLAHELRLPRLVLAVDVDGRSVRISNFTAPHRSRDAYFLDAELDGTPFDETDVGRALAGATGEEATAFLRYSPNDLVYGVWDSWRGRRIAVKVARSYTSEMLGWRPVRGKRAATKGDPLNLPGGDKVATAEWRPNAQTKTAKRGEIEMSRLGYGMVPSSPEEEAGGVSVDDITRQAVLSFAGLARLGFPLDDRRVDREARSALAALALLADRLAFAGPGLHLRSGSDLVLEGETLEWVTRGGETETFDLTPGEARRLFDSARDRLADVGVAWDGAEVVVRPTERLEKVIRRTFTEVVLDAGE